MLVIPIQPVPNQVVRAVLGGQNCQMAIYQKNQGLFFDLNSNGSDMTVAAIALNAVWLDPHAAYDSFIGNLLFIDTQGNDDPTYTGLGSRFILVWLDAAEYAASLILNEIPSLIYILATDLGVTIYTSDSQVIEVIVS